jgi:EAL domain-containing protein (putative c-di-GMP-specific phosphodiesterase class I)
MTLSAFKLPFSNEYSDHLELYYQIQYDLNSGLPVSAEALLRSKIDKLNRAPSGLLASAERDGSITQLTLWVIEQALKDLPFIWSIHGIERVAVNVSALDITKEGFMDKVRFLLNKAGVEGSCLELEITEGMPVVRMQQAIKNIHLAQDLGIRVVLDDFGTGYTSLPALIRLPVQGIKLDKSFSLNIECMSHQAVIDSLIMLGERLNLSVMMEGIEDKAMQDSARVLGCHMGQGYHLHKPQHIADIISRRRAVG